MPVPIGTNVEGTYNTFTSKSATIIGKRLSDGANYQDVYHQSGIPVLGQVKSYTTKGVVSKIGNTQAMWKHPTSYSRRCHRYDFTPGSYTYEQDGWEYTWIGVRLDRNPPQDNPYWVSWNFREIDHDGRQKAITQALDKLNDQKAQLLTFMAEAAKSASMLQDDALKLLRVLQDVRKGRLSRVPKDLRPIKFMGQNWLKWRYGYRPLIGDLHDIANDIIAGVTSQPLIMTAKSTVVTSRSGQIDLPQDANRKRNGSYNTTLRDTCALWVTVDDKIAQRLKNIGLGNPLGVAWELVPYSFVLDWFVPIGKTLSALDAPEGLGFLAGFISQARFGEINTDEFCGRCKQRYHIFVRDRLFDFPKPRIYAVDNPFNLTRVADLLALINQLRK
jgi:hypothetical protein